MKRVSLIALALIVGCGLNFAQGNGPLFSTDVFCKGENGYDTFRIPAVVRAESGDILAFAEARRNSPKDYGDIDLVLKRSTDGGRTWGEMTVVWDDKDNVCGNPSVVVSGRSGRVILLATWNYGKDTERKISLRESEDTRRVFCLYSDDDGLTWSDAREITADVKKPEWTWYATGPCHAVQKVKAPHKGRIIVPCDHGDFDEKVSHSHIIYSDDDGLTWHLGGDPGTGNESTVAELKNGALMLIMRGTRTPDRTGQYRTVSLSRDGGKTFSAPYKEKALIEPVCEASLINYCANGKLSSTLLFSNPECMPERKNMTIKQSDDSGRTWHTVILLSEKPAAYSDMVVLGNGDVGIFYETGEEGPYEKMVFSLIPAAVFTK